MVVGVVVVVVVVCLGDVGVDGVAVGVWAGGACVINTATIANRISAAAMPAITVLFI